ncbi:carboxypeptidase-like regulatory domain-containing protein [Zobellia sp.]|nr:carboxypeptidase-like regulatory domain-containing protein [Zobellia sp.]
MKKCGKNHVLLNEGRGRKLNLKMKFSLVLAFFVLLQLSANSTFSQKNIEFDYKEVPLKKVLNKIKSQSGYSFFYMVDEIDDEKKISFTAKKESIEDVLRKLSLVAVFDFKINEKQIVLTKRNVPKVIKEQEQEIKGVVKDEGGAPLPGANVLIKGTKIGTQTDFDGNFSLVIPNGTEPILLISYIGFKTTEVNVAGKNYIDVQLIIASAQLDDVVVIGSRSNLARTNVEQAVPVDVINSKDLAATGQTELGQQIHFQAPSFNSTKYGIVNVTSYVDPATLRGLGTDQTLVLINGKRRHQSAALNVNRVVGRGSVGTDLNAIPSGAIERVEILRNGAAAQYGSDAIAGIVNIVLKRDANENSVIGSTGISSRGDGVTYDLSVNLGNKIANIEDSYLNTTFYFHHNGLTDRKDTYEGFVFDRDDAANDELLIQQNGFDRDKDVGTQFGQSRNTMGAIIFNGGIPLSDTWEIYGYGGLSHKFTIVWFF